MHRRRNNREEISEKMGNLLKKSFRSNDEHINFTFHGYLEEEDISNGLCFNNVYLPEEIVQNILSYIDVKEVLLYTRVCKKWCNIIKSDRFWQDHYNNIEYPRKAKMWPWYVLYCYFTTDNFKNLIKNGNGENQYEDWEILKNGGDKFTIEDPPQGADPLPLDVPEFNGHTSCFATSYGVCQKAQVVPIMSKRLLRYILSHHAPVTLYASEWMAARFDCGSVYNLRICAYGVGPERESLVWIKETSVKVEQWEGKAWQKVEISIDLNLDRVGSLVFVDDGVDRQCWKGHYGSKFAGALLRFELDTVQLKNDIEMDDGENL